MSTTTTTTYVDLADAPMLDYTSDTDFTMHPSDSSPGWLTVEATMSDDTIISAAPAPEDYPDTIEVDMEPHAEVAEIPEYDMAGDDADALHPEVIVDAVLIDVAEATDPSMAVPISPATMPASTIDVPVELPLDAALHAVEPSTVVEPVFEPIPAAALQEPSTTAVDVVHDLHEVHEQSSFKPPVVDASSDAFAAYEVPSVVEAPEEALAAPSDSAPADSTEVAVPQPAADAAQAAEVVEGGTYDSQEGTEAAAPYDETSGQHEEPYAEPTVDHEEVYAEPAAHHEAVEEQAPYEEEHATASNGEDPHEISEGVYIDPPSAVLLSLVSSSGQSEFTLFNQPHHSPGSLSPSAYASTSTALDLTLLLHERPTLYYEPLSNVFDALREEEAISSISEFADGELVLDAYDLDLKITEDNVYAREVTIHDLNTVHDGSDLRGPLRLRLSASPIRFITRYRALRDQIMQLTLGLEDEVGGFAEDDGGIGQEPSEVPGEYDQGEALPDTSYEYAEEGYEVEAPEVEAPAAAEDAAVPLTAETAEHVQESRAPEEAHEVEKPHQAEEAREDAHEDQYGEFADTVDQPEGSHIEYGTEVLPSEPTEGLDADTMHKHTDAEDGGDYTDYAESPADDDGQDDDGQYDDGKYDEETTEEYDGDTEANAYFIDAEGVEENENEEYAENAGADAATAEEEQQEHTEHPDEVTGTHAKYDNVQVEPLDSSAVGISTTLDTVKTTEPDVDLSSHTKIDTLDRIEYPENEELQDYDEPEADESTVYYDASLEAEWNLSHTGDEAAESSAGVHDNDDALSKYSSDTLSTIRSKRSRDEEDEDDALYASPPGSPDSKRARVL